MDGKKRCAGGISKQNETCADDKIDETGADIEKPIAVVDGEDAPFRGYNENKADNTATSNNGGANRKNGEGEIEKNVHERAKKIATFADENIICHMIHYSKEMLTGKVFVLYLDIWIWK